MIKANIIGYNQFLTSFSSNKPELIRFFVDKLIKHAHNSVTNFRIHISLSKYLFSEWKSASGGKHFGGGFADAWRHLNSRVAHIHQHPSTSLYVVKKMNGLIAILIVKCALIIIFVSNFFYYLVHTINYGFEFFR